MGRDSSGCLTPSFPENENTKGDYHPSVNYNYSRKNSILSPPLSPYQRDEAVETISTKTYVKSSKPFRIENYKTYRLTVNPWQNLSGYKSKHQMFLDKYASLSTKEASVSRVHEKRLSRKRLATVVESDSDSNVERVRTRRVVKENSVHLSESDSTPKKKKRKETSYAGSPLAIQQAALIDENIPDYSPDANETLPKGNVRALKVEWKGQPMDLRNDANLDKLHPAEVMLASTLRLPCNVYLDSKRRLFHEKVSRFKKGMQFRRTDAQKACRIDVNKASRLFAAFEKVGWLNDEHFEKYL